MISVRPPAELAKLAVYGAIIGKYGCIHKMVCSQNMLSAWGLPLQKFFLAP